MCESGGNYHALNASSGAGGAYQILPSTWRAYGGRARRRTRPRHEQDRIAARDLARLRPERLVLRLGQEPLEHRSAAGDRLQLLRPHQDMEEVVVEGGDAALLHLHPRAGRRGRRRLRSPARGRPASPRPGPRPARAGRSRHRRAGRPPRSGSRVTRRRVRQFVWRAASGWSGRRRARHRAPSALCPRCDDWRSPFSVRSRSASGLPSPSSASPCLSSQITGLILA